MDDSGVVHALYDNSITANSASANTRSLPVQAGVALEELCSLLSALQTNLSLIRTEVYALEHTASEAREIAGIGLERKGSGSLYLARIDQIISQHLRHHTTDEVLCESQSLILRARINAATLADMITRLKVASAVVASSSHDSLPE